VNLTRADIRRTLLRRGRYDLDDPEDVRRLDKYVEGFERWVRSDVAKMLNGEPLHLSPRELLNGVKWGNSNMAIKNEKDVLASVKGRRPLKLIGNAALRVAIAFAKQACLQWGWEPRHLAVSNLITDAFDYLTAGPRSVLILSTWPDADHGKLFVEAKAKLVSLLGGHSGATIIISERDERGILDCEVATILRPKLMLKVSIE